MNIKTLNKSALALMIISSGILSGTLTACAAERMAPEMTKGTASKGLITLATTGKPAALKREIGGKIISSAALQKRAGKVLDLKKDEHLAPKALVLNDGRIYAMVAPTITKDNFIFVDKNNNLMRMDVGFTEGHRKPFVVNEIVGDGGTPWYTEFWYWLGFGP